MLNSEQLATFKSLGYMYLSLNLHDKAERLFKALAAMYPEDLWVKKNLAATAIANNELELALKYLSELVDEKPLLSQDAVLYLMKGQVLWKLERKIEAKKYIDEYLLMIASNKFS